MNCFELARLLHNQRIVSAEDCPDVAELVGELRDYGWKINRIEYNGGIRYVLVSEGALCN